MPAHQSRPPETRSLKPDSLKPDNLLEITRTNAYCHGYVMFNLVEAKMKRTERLFAIAEFLRGRRTGTTAEQIADRFGVSIRTIYRDIDALKFANLPLQTEQGRGGGVALTRHYSMPPINFSVQEATLLVTVSEMLVRLRWMPFSDTLMSAADKVRAALPRAAQAELNRVRAGLTWAAVPALAASEAVRTVIESAWYDEAAIRITYSTPRKTSTRDVKITSVVLTRNETMLNCVDLGLNEARQFKLHCITAASRM